MSSVSPEPALPSPLSAANMPAPTIRRAIRDDVPAIIRLLIHGAVVGTGIDTLDDNARALYLDAFEEIDAEPNEALFVAEVDGIVMGTLQITFCRSLVNRARLRATVESVHVAPEMRGKRIGAAMIAHAIEVARARGAGVVQLTSNKKRTDAHRFYERLGFKRSHEGFKLEF